MRTADDYRKRIVRIHASSSAFAAARSMELDAVGCLVVVDDDDRAVGILTDRDLAVRAVATSHAPAEIRVSDLMSRDLVAVAPDTPRDDVVALMRTRGIRRVPVLADGAPVGIVSLDEVLLEVSRELEVLSAEAPNRYRTAPVSSRFEHVRRRLDRGLEELRGNLAYAKWYAGRSFVDGLDELRHRLTVDDDAEGTAIARSRGEESSGDPMQALRDEHRLILDVATVLERLVDAGVRTGRLYADDARVALRFLREFACEHHGRKEEEVLFGELANAGLAADRAPVQALSAEHESQREQLARLEAHLEASTAGHEPQLFEFAKDAEAYVAAVREHVVKEDDILFAVATGLLPDAARAELASAFERFEREHDGEGVGSVRDEGRELVARYLGPRAGTIPPR